MEVYKPINLRYIKKSATLELAAKVKSKIKNGEDIKNLTIGEPDLPPPSFVSDFLKKLNYEKFSRYYPVRGSADAISAVSSWFAKMFGAGYDEDEIIITNGAKEALFLACMSLFDQTSEVLLPTPYWVSYAPMLTLTGARIKKIKTRIEDDFLPDIDEIESKITSNTRGIIINSPSNPTGTVYPPEYLKIIGEIAIKNNLVIISDEVYGLVVYTDRFKTVSRVMEGLKERSVVITGMSKTYSIPGFRIGFALSSSEIIKRMATIKGHLSSNTNSLMIELVASSLGKNCDFVYENINIYKERRDKLVDYLRSHSEANILSPHGTFYLFPDLRMYLGRRFGRIVVDSTVKLAEIMLEHGNVAVVPGEAFDAPGYVRISFASSMEDLMEGAKRICNVLAELK